MKSDAQLQKDVMDQLKWEPFLNEAAIGVAVKNGIVTLSGVVENYSKKMTAEKAAKKVAGVRAIAEDIQISVSPARPKTDTNIAGAVLNALKAHVSVPDEKLQVKVEDGIVTLEGEMEWEYEREAAKTAIENLAGIRNIFNNITIKSRLKPEEVKQKINTAFQRSAIIDAGKISVEVSESKVILHGKVRSFAEKEDAANAAWKTPGVTLVENRLEIEPLWAYASL